MLNIELTLNIEADIDRDLVSVLADDVVRIVKNEFVTVASVELVSYEVEE